MRHSKMSAKYPFLAWVLYLMAIFFAFVVGGTSGNHPFIGGLTMGVSVIFFITLGHILACGSQGISIVFGFHYLVALFSFVRYDIIGTCLTPGATTYSNPLEFVMLAPVQLVILGGILIVFVFTVATEVDSRRKHEGIRSIINTMGSPRFFFSIVMGLLSGLNYIPAF